jgi:hypothetical protein
MGVVCGAVWEQCGRLVGTGVLKDSTKAAVSVWCGGGGGCGLCSLVLAPSATATGVITNHNTRIFLLLACAQQCGSSVGAQ